MVTQKKGDMLHYATFKPRKHLNEDTNFGPNHMLTLASGMGIIKSKHQFNKKDIASYAISKC